MQNQIMKAQLTNTNTSQRNNNFDQPLDIQISHRSTHFKREISPQPFKPSADEPSKFPGLRSPIKVKMTQLSPKKIQETPNEAAPSRSKSNILTNRQRQDSETLNSAIYKNLFQKFNQRSSSPSSNSSQRRLVDIQEVYKLRQEMMEKYDKHVQSKRRLSSQNQNLKLLLKSKSERAGTKIGTSEEQSIVEEERKFSKNDIQDFLLRVERSQERKKRGISQAASQKSLDVQQWKMLPKSRMIVSKSLDKYAFQNAYSSARKSKPLFETMNFTPKLAKSISKTELKRDHQPESELRIKQIMNPYESTIKFEIEQIQASINDVVRQAPQTQSLLGSKYKKKINKIFKRKLELISAADNQIDMVVLLKMIGAITSCTVEKRLVPNHPYIQKNFETLILAILDLNQQDINDCPRSSQFIINKLLSEDKVKSAARVVGIQEQLNLTLAQERRLQQHFGEFATQLRKKRLSAVKYRTALGSPQRSKANFQLVSNHERSQQLNLDAGQNTQSSETFQHKRDQFLNQIIDQVDKMPEQRSSVFQKRHTQADLRSAVKSQLETRKSPNRLEGQISGRKSVNQKSRNTPTVYSLATETQIRTIRDKSKADLAQMVQRSQSRNSTIKRPLTRQIETTPMQSPRFDRQFKHYDPAATIAAQNLLEKRIPSSGRTSKTSSIVHKKQPLTSKRKVPTTTTILLENRAPLFVQQSTTEKVKILHPEQPSAKPDTVALVATLKEVQEQTNKQIQSPKSLSIEIQLPVDHALQVAQDLSDSKRQEEKQADEQQSQYEKSLIKSEASQDQIYEFKKHKNQDSDQNHQVFEQKPQNLDLDIIIDQQSKPSDLIEQKRESEPLFDQQSRPSEKLEIQPDQNLLTPKKKAESRSEPLSDSLLSQNQGQQIEEQGAKDIENSAQEESSKISVQIENDQKSQKHVEEQDNLQPEQQLLQARFSNISKQSSSQFLSNSVVESEKAVDQMLTEVKAQDYIGQDHKLTITEVGNSDIQNENQVEDPRPKYMTFSQPSHDQEEHAQATANEANDSIKAILLALNQTQDAKNNNDMDINSQKQVISGSEQGKNSQQIECSPTKVEVSPKSETAFERYQRLKKEKELSISSSPGREGLHSSEGKDSLRKPSYAKYVPKHSSPNISQKSDIRSWRSEVQVETIQLNEDQNFLLREEPKQSPIVEQIIIETERQQVLELSVPETYQKQETVKKIKNLSFAEDLNQQTHSSQDQVDQKIDVVPDYLPKQLTILTPNQDKQINNEPEKQLQQISNDREEQQHNNLYNELEVQSERTSALLNLDTNKAVQQNLQLDAEIEKSNQSIPSESKFTPLKVEQQHSEELWLPDPVEPDLIASSPVQQEIRENKPKETIQDQLKAIKQGFLQFMSKKTEESPPEEKPKNAPSQKVYDQVNDMIKRVQENIKDKVQEIQSKKQDEELIQEKQPSQSSQVLQSVGSAFKKVKENVQQTNISEVLKSTENTQLKPLQDRVSQNIPVSTFKSIADAIPSETINKIKQRLPQNSIVDIVTSATQSLKEGDVISSVINAAENTARNKLKDTLIGDLLPVTKQPLTVENPYLKQEKEPRLENLDDVQNDLNKYVDKMAAILDRLDKEYEEELKNKPKTLEKKSPRKQQREESEKSQSGSLVRKKTADSSASSKKNNNKSRKTPPKTTTPLKKSKTELYKQEQKEIGTPKQPLDIPESQPIKKQSTYHAFPNRIVDAPEIMFFLPSWFQINGKRTRK